MSSDSVIQSFSQAERHQQSGRSRSSSRTEATGWKTPYITPGGINFSLNATMDKPGSVYYLMRKVEVVNPLPAPTNDEIFNSASGTSSMSGHSDTPNTYPYSVSFHVQGVNDGAYAVYVIAKDSDGLQPIEPTVLSFQPTRRRRRTPRRQPWSGPTTYYTVSYSPNDGSGTAPYR